MTKTQSLVGNPTSFDNFFGPNLQLYFDHQKNSTAFDPPFLDPPFWSRPLQKSPLHCPRDHSRNVSCRLL